MASDADEGQRARATARSSAWRKLRWLRRSVVAAMLVGPFAGAGIVVWLASMDVPDASRYGLVVVVPIVVSIMFLLSFECPGCGRSFSKSDGRGVQLTNKRCMGCGLGVGE